MNFHSPTQADLRAFCGWAIANGHPQVADVVEPIICDAPESPVVFQTSTEPDPVATAKRVFSFYPDDPLTSEYVDQASCKHSFNIKTRHCVHCGISYLEYRQRQPELF